MMTALSVIYAPNKDSPQFFQEKIKDVSMKSENVIMIGDFDTVLNNVMD